MKKIKIQTICETLDLDESTLIRWIETRLVLPSDPEALFFDEEDLSRIRLLKELTELYTSDEETLGLILHLIDQIYHLKSELKKNM